MEQIVSKKHIKLNPVEFLAMIESKMCDNHHMTFSIDGCFYDQPPVGEFDWFRNNVFVNYNYKFH